MSDLACRFCRIPVAADGGCAMCADFRKNLIAADEDADTRPALADVTSEAIAGLRTMLRSAKPALSSDDEKLRGRAEQRYLGAATTLAKMVDSARKLMADGAAYIRTLPFADRAELFVSWYQGLAPAHRARLRAAMDRFESALAKPREPRQLMAPE